MTFEERVRSTIGQLHFANMQLAHQVEELQQQLAMLQKLAKQEEKELPPEIRGNGDQAIRKNPRI